MMSFRTIIGRIGIVLLLMGLAGCGNSSGVQGNNSPTAASPSEKSVAMETAQRVLDTRLENHGVGPVAGDELAAEYLDFETARRALVVMAEKSNDPLQKKALADLLSPPSRDLPGNLYRFQEGFWQIDLDHRRWSARLGTNPPWVYHGEFFKNESGAWVTGTASRNYGMRGGR